MPEDPAAEADAKLPVHTPKKTHHVSSLVLVHTGHGKGKTSAAAGIMVRGLARGWKVAVVQFVKSGKWKVGERKIGEQLGVDWSVMGDGFTWESDDIDHSAELARNGWQIAKAKIASGDFDLVILEEVTYPVTYGWVDVADVVRTIEQRPENVSVVITGRDAAPELLDVADTVTEMRNVKHAYQSGIAAKKGIDY